MKYFDWNPQKNRLLQDERGICFEDIVSAIEEGGLLEAITHPNQAKYPNQLVYLIEFEEYVYLVPYVEDDLKIFLKTIIPSRKMTKRYLIDRRTV